MRDHTRAWLHGFTGMLIFSASLPATRLAVQGFDPLFLTLARAAIAGLLGLALLLMLRPAQRPRRAELVPLAVVAAGVVLGFPLLTALALRHMSAAQSLLFAGMLPLATAFFAVLRGGERPRPAFWAFALAGAALVAGHALLREGGPPPLGSALMVLAILACGLGYAEGARLSRHLGGWQVICWALCLALPWSMALGLLLWPDDLARVGGAAWAGLAYVSLFSMLIGFVFWYRGLALGGIASVGQIQLLQPFFGLLIASLLLGETVDAGMLGVALVTCCCVAGARRFGAPPSPPRQA